MARPRIYESVEELDKAIDDYFYPMTWTEMQTGAGIIKSEPFKSTTRISKPTVTGLALALGFADKTTLYEYRDRDEFSYSVKRALMMIENYHEEGLSENNVAGRIFALKNMGWKDKSESDVNLNGGVRVVMKSIASDIETK